jgi:hypothetical protein
MPSGSHVAILFHTYQLNKGLAPLKNGTRTTTPQNYFNTSIFERESKVMLPFK